jgi:sugar phosphate isomerase/epimerase
MGIKLLTFHAGFLPHDDKHPDYSKMLGRLKEVERIFSAQGIPLAMETGQETAADLLRVLQELNRDTGAGIGVNFDPANMILYAKGEPIEALRLLAPWVRQVHIKDATRTTTPGTWGTEVPAGTGEVNWREFFATLKQCGFAGNLVIEREAGNQRVEDIKTARAMVESLAG